MQEYQVTVTAARVPLDRPLFVLATQNPIEQEGTYPLPEAQLDRFMFNVVIDYPSAEEERRILARRPGPRSAIAVVATGEEIERLHASCATCRRPRTSSTTRRGWCARRARPGRRRRRAGVRREVGALGRGPARRAGAAPRRQGARLLEGRSVGVARGRARRGAAGAAPPRPVNFQAEADGIDADAIVRQLLDADAGERRVRVAPMLDPQVLTAIGDLELVARVTVDGTVSGLHRSPFHGYSAEFSQYRHYRPGDDLKYVDWKLFARTDRFYTKQFRETTNLSRSSRSTPAVDGVRRGQRRVEARIRAAAGRRAGASDARPGRCGRAWLSTTRRPAVHLPSRSGRAPPAAVLVALSKLQAVGAGCGGSVERGGRAAEAARPPARVLRSVTTRRPRSRPSCARAVGWA